LFCVDFNKNKYEGALTQSAAKEQGTLQFGIQLIFGNGLSWRSEHQRMAFIRRVSNNIDTI
jgi:hypothetical protein